MVRAADTQVVAVVDVALAERDAPAHDLAVWPDESHGVHADIGRDHQRRPTLGHRVVRAVDLTQRPARGTDVDPMSSADR